MRKAIGSFKLLILVTALACYSVLLPAQTFNVIYNFTGGQDGGGPETGLTLVGTGTLYGTTWHGGGMNQGGTAYRLKHVGSGWVLQPLYAFAGDSDGCNSDSMLGFGPDGSLYGTTVYGGIVGCSGNSYGTVFNIRPQPTPPPSPLTPWHETVIHTFNGSVDGAYPHDLTFDAAGNIYGTTQQGALGSGTVYRLRKVSGSWVEDILYRFTGASDGGQPKAGVIRDSNGNLYGTTPFGGGIGYGTVFQLTESGGNWTISTLHNFGYDPDGGLAFGGLVSDLSGNLYGTTSTGGVGGGGTVFKLQRSGQSWTFSVLYSFSGIGVPGPQASLIMDSAGNLYGTTFNGGAYSKGSVFKLTNSGGGTWTYTSLHDFTGGSDGGDLYSSLVLDSSGNIYGTTYSGGTHANGVIFEITQ